MAVSYPQGGGPSTLPPEPSETNIWALASIISGVLAWLGLFGIGGLVAIIAGHVAKGQIRQSAGRMSGDGLATAGLVLGYANVALTLLTICLILLAVFGVITMPFICTPAANWFEIQ